MRLLHHGGVSDRPLTSLSPIHPPAGRFRREGRPRPLMPPLAPPSGGRQGLHQPAGGPGSAPRHGRDHPRGAGSSGPEALPRLSSPVADGETGGLRIPFGAVVPWAFSDRPDGPNSVVGDPGIAPGLCLFPKQVGRCLPMSPWTFEGGCGRRDSNPQDPRSQRGASARVAPRPRVPGGGIAPPSPRCERGILLLEEPDEGWLRDPESNRLSAAYETARDPVFRPAECLVGLAGLAPARPWGHQFLRLACLLDSTTDPWFREELHLQ